VDQATVSLVLGLGGIAGTLVGSLVAPRLTARQAQRHELRNGQRQLYVDALVHARVFSRRVDRFADRYYGDGSSQRERDRSEAALVARDQITARMTLIGHPQVAETWRDMVLVDEAWDNYWNEALGGGAAEVHHRGLGEDDEWVVRARAAVDAFQRECRSALRGGRAAWFRQSTNRFASMSWARSRFSTTRERRR
jgi:hypothetical protein